MNPADSANSAGVFPELFLSSHAISPPGHSTNCMHKCSKPHFAAKCNNVGYSSEPIQKQNFQN